MNKKITKVENLAEKTNAFKALEEGKRSARMLSVVFWWACFVITIILCIIMVCNS